AERHVQVSDTHGGVFLDVETFVEGLRTAKGIVHVEVAGNRRHGTKLLAEIKAAIRGLDVSVAEVDQADKVRVVHGLYGSSGFGRGLAVRARLCGEDVLECDAYAVGLTELGQLVKRLTLALVCRGTIEDLVGAKIAAVLNENTGADPVADFSKRLGGIKLIAAGGRVH